MSRRAPADLLEMLSYRRPSGSGTETEFVKRFLLPLGVARDGSGNLIRRIGDAPVLWSCHTDTVHRKSGRQTVRIDEKGWVTLAKGQKNSSCLGADDTAGVWLLREMMRAEVEGLYVFHFGEEVGGIGSTHIARETPELIEECVMAIALDRRGQDSVVSHQGSRCCSDTFANALGDALGLGMEADPTGLFTDTANYTELIPECTNLSVGYEGAHSDKESLDVGFLVALRERLLKLDVGRLPITRDPAVDDLDDWRGGWRYAGNYGNGFDALEGFTVQSSEHHRMVRLIQDEPETVADILEHYGVSADEVEQWKN